jgi:hypothetical protein
VIVVKMRDENRIESQIPDLAVIEPDLRECVAIPAEGVFENRIKGDQRAAALKEIPRVKDP